MMGIYNVWFWSCNLKLEMISCSFMIHMSLVSGIVIFLSLFTKKEEKRWNDDVWI